MIINRLIGLDLKKLIGKVCCCLETYDSKNWFYWLDKKTYRIIGDYNQLPVSIKNRIDNNDDRYIRLPQYISDERYVDLMNEIDNQKVYDYFNLSEDIEDTYYRYRVFIDVNGVELQEWYKIELSTILLLIQWSEKNNIRYRVSNIKKPYNYFYDNVELKNVDWSIPHTVDGQWDGTTEIVRDECTGGDCTENGSMCSMK